MAAVVLGQVWTRDLPVCLPGRACVDQSPVAAPLMHATSALTPFSPLIAAGCWAATGLALLTIVVCVQRQRRGRGVSGRAVMLIAALLLAGAGTSWVVRGRLALISAIFSSISG